MVNFLIKEYTPHEAIGLVNLWHACFSEDDASYAERFIAALPSETIVVVGEVNTCPVAMCFLLPATAAFREYRFAVRYLYAGCTHPAHRGNGYYRQILDYAAQFLAKHGEHAIFLHPADDALTKTYERLGYRRGISSAHIATPTQALPSMTAEAYWQIRETLSAKAQSQAVSWALISETARFFFDETLKYGARTHGDSTTIALYTDETLIEAFPPTINAQSDYCLWQPINNTPLLMLMQKHGGFTGNIGE